MHPAPILAEPRNADLGGHDGIVADRAVVGYLDEVVELDTVADAGRTHHGTVYSGVGAYLDIVGYDHVAGLGNLLIVAVDGGESESVASDDCARVDDAPRTYLASGIYLDTGIEDCSLAYLAAVADVCLGIYLGPGADDGTLADICERPHIGVIRNLDPGGYERGLLDALLLDSGHLGHHVEQVRDGCVGVIHAYHGGCDGMLGHKVATHEYDGRLCVVDVVGIFRICQE